MVARAQEQVKLAPWVFTDAEGEHCHTRHRRNKLTKIVLGDMKPAGIPGASLRMLQNESSVGRRVVICMISTIGCMAGWKRLDPTNAVPSIILFAIGAAVFILGRFLD